MSIYGSAIFPFGIHILKVRRKVNPSPIVEVLNVLAHLFPVRRADVWAVVCG